MPDRITRGIQPAIVSAQKDHIEVMSFQWGVGLIRNETLRVTVSDPNQLPTTNEPVEPVRARVTLFKEDGSPIRETIEFTIPRGGFTFVDFQRADLPVPGDSLTGRLQVMAKVILWVRDARVSGLSPVSGEIINDSTGQTQVYGGFSGGVRVASGDVN
jgi:hypothetical protein